jgi:hypothetical protein
VTFSPASNPYDTAGSYAAPLTFDNPSYPNAPAFSFDTTTASSSYNDDQSIPSGDYVVWVSYTFPNGWAGASYRSQVVHHAYAGSCKDTYAPTANVPCELYKVVLYYGVYPQDCPQPSYAGNIVTVPACTLGGSNL